MHHRALFFLATSPGTSTSVPFPGTPLELSHATGQEGAGSVPRLLLACCLPSLHWAGTCPPPPTCLLATGLLVGPATASSPSLQAVGCCLHQRGHRPWVTTPLSSLITLPYGEASLLLLSDNADDQTCSKR